MDRSWEFFQQFSSLLFVLHFPACPWQGCSLSPVNTHLRTAHWEQEGASQNQQCQRWQSARTWKHRGGSLLSGGAVTQDCKALDWIPPLLSKHTEDSANTSLTEVAEKQELFHLFKSLCFRDRIYFPLFLHQLGFVSLSKITSRYLLQKEGCNIRFILALFGGRMIAGCTNMFQGKEVWLKRLDFHTIFRRFFSVFLWCYYFLIAQNMYMKHTTTDVQSVLDIFLAPKGRISEGFMSNL